VHQAIGQQKVFLWSFNVRSCSFVYYKLCLQLLSVT